MLEIITNLVTRSHLPSISRFEFNFGNYEFGIELESNGIIEANCTSNSKSVKLNSRKPFVFYCSASCLRAMLVTEKCTAPIPMHCSHSNALLPLQYTTPTPMHYSHSNILHPHQYTNPTPMHCTHSNALLTHRFVYTLEN